MKFLVLGAGSLGSIYGGMLDVAGHDVTLVARGQNYEALRKNGLTIKTQDGQLNRNMKVARSPKEADVAEVAFLTVKARDTHSILEESAHLFGKTIFISLQNAAETDKIVSKYAGANYVIGGVSTVGATLTQPGVVDYTAVGYNWLGELPRGKSERVEKIVKLLNHAQIPTGHAADITAIKWAKLVVFCANAGPGCLTRLRTSQFLRDPELAAVYVNLIKEGGNVMKAAGFTLQDHDHLPPIKKINELPEQVTVQECVDHAKKEPDSEKRVTISMLQDLLNNKPLEVDETLGYIVRTAAELKVDVPTFRVVYHLLRGLSRLNSGKAPDAE